MQGRMSRGQFRGRGRSWGRGMPGGFRRAGGPPLDPAVLERRRKSTAAAVQRQLENVLVSEELAGSKVWGPDQHCWPLHNPLSMLRPPLSCCRGSRITSGLCQCLMGRRSG